MKQIILLILPLLLVVQSEAQNELIASTSNDFKATSTSVDRNAYFSNEYDLGTYIKENFNYPKDANEADISGKMQVRMVILEDGSAQLMNIKGIESESIKTELKRVIEEMPVWEPAYKNGRAAKQVVKFYMDLQLD